MLYLFVFLILFSTFVLFAFACLFRTFKQQKLFGIIVLCYDSLTILFMV